LQDNNDTCEILPSPTKRAMSQVNNRYSLSLDTGGVRLVIAGGLLTLIWLVMLPALTRQRDVAARIDRLESQGIDPTAIFYSELDAMPAAEAFVSRLRSGEEDPFW
jgi:hypothetical protein